MDKSVLRELSSKELFPEIALDLDGADAAKVEMASLLRSIGPLPQEHPSGFMYYSPEDVKYFDALFDRFGLTLRSGDDQFDDLKYVAEMWYRLVGHFGAFIECADLWPKIFERRLAEWPPGFAEYLRAVMADDREKSRALASALNIEKLAAEMPRELMG